MTRCRAIDPHRHDLIALIGKRHGIGKPFAMTNMLAVAATEA